MQCFCLLSGTEAAAMNAVDTIAVGSRGSGAFATHSKTASDTMDYISE